MRAAFSSDSVILDTQRIFYFFKRQKDIVGRSFASRIFHTSSPVSPLQQPVLASELLAPSSKGEVMSLITDDPDKSPRHCSRKLHHGRRMRRALIAVSSMVVSLLSLAVILWLTLLRPSSPRFSLLATATNNGTVIVVEAAFTAHNPNAHAVALYDQLRVSASYADVPLGVSAALPSLEQPEGDVVMSAVFKSPWTAEEGPALLRTRIKGQLRWKVPAWVSGRHGLTVDCVGVVQGSLLQSQCATHVLS